MEKARAFDYRPWLALLAVGLAAAAIWAATARAGGGSSNNEPAGGGNMPSFIQDDGAGPQGGSKEDCPERGGGTGDADTGGPGV